MKITRSELKKLISEEVAQSSSILLEMPASSTTGMSMGGLDNVNTGDPEEAADETTMHLFHVINQAQTLHAMLAVHSAPEIDPEMKKYITRAYKLIDRVFKTLTHETAGAQGQGGPE